MNFALKDILSRVERITSPMVAESIFEGIAATLFERFHIERGDARYFFLEVEFYYFSESHPDRRRHWPRPFVYPRSCDAGVFFTHTSGLDICFESKMDDRGKFISGGGILLRSLLRETPDHSQTVVAGPWDCFEALMNYSEAGKYPVITESNTLAHPVELKKTRRYHDFSELVGCRYCFYNAHYHRGGHWASPEEGRLRRYDPVSGGVKKDYSIKPWNR